MSDLISSNYFAEIKQILANARQQAYAAINSAMVEAYWRIGERIVQEEQNGKERADYGKEVLQKLSIELTKEFGKGFSYRSLREIRQFYLLFPDYPNLANSVRQIRMVSLSEGIKNSKPTSSPLLFNRSC